MNASTKFKFIGTNAQKMLIPITTNQNFKRYIKYLDNTPLSIDKVDIQGTLINENILVKPFSDTLLTDAEVKIFFNPFIGNLESEPKGYDKYIFDIIVPIDSWVLDGEGEFRAFLIAHEIAKEIDGRSIAGVGKVEITDWKVYKINEEYAGLALFVTVVSTTVRG